STKRSVAAKKRSSMRGSLQKKRGRRASGCPTTDLRDPPQECRSTAPGRCVKGSKPTGKSRIRIPLNRQRSEKCRRHGGRYDPAGSGKHPRGLHQALVRQGERHYGEAVSAPHKNETKSGPCDEVRSTDAKT